MKRQPTNGQVCQPILIKIDDYSKLPANQKKTVHDDERRVHEFWVLGTNCGKEMLLPAIIVS